MVLSAAVAVVRTRKVPPSRIDPAKTVSPGPFVAGSDSPVMAASFAEATPGEHDAVNGEPLAGPHDDRLADRDLGDGHRDLGAVTRRTVATGGASSISPVIGAPRAVERRRLQHGAEAEEEGDEARL